MYYLKKALKKRVAQDARKSAYVPSRSRLHGRGDPTACKAIKNLTKDGYTDSRTL